MYLQVIFQVNEADWEKCLVMCLPELFPHLGLLFSYKLNRADFLQSNFADMLMLRRQCHRKIIQLWVKKGTEKNKVEGTLINRFLFKGKLVGYFF